VKRCGQKDTAEEIGSKRAVGKRRTIFAKKKVGPPRSLKKPDGKTGQRNRGGVKKEKKKEAEAREKKVQN